MDTVITNHDGTRALGFVREDARGGLRVVMGAGQELTQEQAFDIFGNVSIEVFEMIQDPAIDAVPDIKNARLKEFRIRHWMLPRRPAPIKPTPEPTGGQVIQFPARNPIAELVSPWILALFLAALMAIAVAGIILEGGAHGA